MTKSEKSLENSTSAFMEACKWRDGAKVLMKQERDYIEVACSIMCFSTEMYLKAILFLEKEDFKTTHRLKYLFDKLPKNIREDIIKEADIKFKDEIDLILLDSVVGYTNFEKAISFISNDFLEKRYNHERFEEKGYIYYDYDLTNEINRAVGIVTDKKLKNYFKELEK